MRFLSIFLLATSLLLGCGLPHTKAPPPREVREQLLEMYSTYKELVGSSRDQYGFVEFDECDSLLFSALLGSVVGGFHLEAAELEPGRFVRRPVGLYPPCYDEETGEGSDISRDMYTGLFFYLESAGRLDVLERIWTYGSENSWKMGRGDERTVATPALIGLLARIIYKLSGGSIDHVERHIPQVWIPVPGYQSHLMMLQIALEGRLYGAISVDQLSALAKIIEISPTNALAHALLHKYTDGNQLVATELLLSQYPRHRLPSSEDWCEAWRVQRADLDPGLRPCPERKPGRNHSGGDFLFVVSLILGDL